jgi:hypothetical protein
MPFEAIIKDAVKDAFGATLAVEIQDAVAKETRRALREHEEEFTHLVRSAVSAAISEIFEEAK